MKRKKIVILILLLILQVVNIFYWGNKKEGFFGDELYSYGFICQTDYPSINADRADTPYLNTWHNSEYYKDYLTLVDDEIYDLSGTYNSIKQDVHPPLFYMLLNISSSLLGGRFTKWSGIALNTIFLILTIIFLYLLMGEITNDPFIQLLAPLFYGFSIGAVTSVIFIRMYMMLACATVIFAYIHAKLWKLYPDLKSSKKRWFLYLALILTTMFGFLSQFFFLIIAFFICLFWWLFLLFSKRIREAIEYTITMAIGLAGCLATWPTVIYQVFLSNRGRQGLNESGQYTKNLVIFLKYIKKELFGNWWILLVGLVVILLLTSLADWLLTRKSSTEKTKNSDENDSKISLKIGFVISILLATILDVLLVSKVAPFKMDRYIFNVYPLIIFCVVMVLLACGNRSLKRLPLKILTFLVISAVLVLSYTEGKKTPVPYLGIGTNRKLNISKKYSDLPVVILTNKNNRFISNCNGFYFQYGQNVYPTDQDSIDTISEALEEVDCGDSFILYLDTTFEEPKDMLHAAKDEVHAKSSKWLYTSSMAQVYLIKK